MELPAHQTEAKLLSELTIMRQTDTHRSKPVLMQRL